MINISNCLQSIKEASSTLKLRSHQIARDKNASFVVHLQLNPRGTVAIRLERRLKLSLAPFLVTANCCNCQSHLLVIWHQCNTANYRTRLSCQCPVFSPQRRIWHKRSQKYRRPLKQMIIHKRLMTQEPARITTNFAQVVQLTRSKSLRFKGEKKKSHYHLFSSLSHNSPRFALESKC